MSGKERIDLPAFLGGVEPYSVLDAESLSALAAAARTTRVGRGQSLFEQGQICDGVYVVMSGQLKLAFSSPNGAEKIVTIATARQSTGEAWLLLGQCYPLHAEALNDSLLVFLPRQAVNKCLRTNQSFVYHMMKYIAEKFHHLLLDVESSSLLSGTERILDFLMREVDALDDDKSATIELALPKSIIASRLSLTQEHFSRLLRQLSESGMIAVDGRLVHIPDIDRLSRFLDSGAGHGNNRNGRSAGRGRSAWDRLVAA